MKTRHRTSACAPVLSLVLLAAAPHLAAQQLQITTTALPNATVGTAYSQAIATSGGTCPGTGTATFSIDAGALPAGLTVTSPAGVKQWTLQGVPTAGGTFQFTLHLFWTHTPAAPSVFDHMCTDDAAQSLALTVAGSGGGGGGGGVLAVDRSQVATTYHTGGILPGAQAVQVTAQGNAAVSFTAQATAVGGNWLSVTPGGGTTPTALNLIFSPVGLAPGVYSGAVFIQSGSSQASVAVTLTVVTDVSGLSIDRTAITVTYHMGHFPPPTEYVQVTAPSNAAVSFTTQTFTPIGTWLSVTPTSGVTPASIGINFSISGLASGVYNGTVTLLGGNSQLVIAVSLTVVTDTSVVLQVNPASLNFSYVTGGQVPASQTLGVSISGDAVIFEATETLSGPTVAAWLIVTPSAAATPAQLSVSVNPKNLTPGMYTGVITLKVQGVATSAQTIPVTFNVQSAPVLPAITQNGVVNAASLSGAIAPGTWVTIFGANLAANTRQWTGADFVAGKLPLSLDGVSVTIDGRVAAVAYISPIQINVLAPDDTSTGLVSVQVNGPGGSSNSTLALEQTAAPAFFQFRANTNIYVAGTHADGSYLAGAGLVQTGLVGTPAKPGEVVVLYGTGFGATQPSISATAQVPSPLPLANVQDLHVRIAGIDCTIVFAGLISPGLYQFNVIVPQVSDGDQTLVAERRGLLTRPDLLLTVQH